MSDPSAILDLSLESIAKAGSGVVAFLAALFSLRWLALRHSKMIDSRVNILEKIITGQDGERVKHLAKIEALHERLLAQSEVHAHDMKVIAVQMLANDKANRDLLRDYHAALTDIADRPHNGFNHEQSPLIRKPPTTETTTGRG